MLTAWWQWSGWRLALCRLLEDPLELRKLGGCRVGNGPEAEVAIVPMAQALAAADQGGAEIAA